MAKSLFDDTHPAIAARQLEYRRRLSPAEKLRQVRSLNEFAVRAAQADLRRRFPEMTADEAERRLAARFLPSERVESVLAARRARGFA